MEFSRDNIFFAQKRCPSCTVDTLNCVRLDILKGNVCTSVFRCFFARYRCSKYQVSAQCFFSSVVNYGTKPYVIIACVRIDACVIECFFLDIPSCCSPSKLNSTYIVCVCLNIYKSGIIQRAYERRASEFYCIINAWICFVQVVIIHNRYLTDYVYISVILPEIAVRNGSRIAAVSIQTERNRSYICASFRFRYHDNLITCICF